MEERPHALLLKFPGTNCDAETSRALQAVGFSTEVVPISKATNGLFKGAQLLVLSGGFSYGDYVMAGRLAQLETELRLGDTLREFRDAGGYLLGICNGFQILTKLGLLPEGSLIHNTSGRFTCRWAELRKQNGENPFLQEAPRKFRIAGGARRGALCRPRRALRRIPRPGSGRTDLRRGHQRLLVRDRWHPRRERPRAGADATPGAVPRSANTTMIPTGMETANGGGGTTFSNRSTSGSSTGRAPRFETRSLRRGDLPLAMSAPNPRRPGGQQHLIL